MRLLSVRRVKGRDPLQLPNGKARDDLGVETVRLFADLIETVLGGNGVTGLEVTYLETGGRIETPGAKPAPAYSLGQRLAVAELRPLIEATFADQIYCKLRDRSCRFVHFGQDYNFWLCLAQDDQLDAAKWGALGVEITDESPRLIESDVFDL